MAFMGATDGVHFTITATDMASRTIRGVGRSLLVLGAAARAADNRMHSFFWRGTDDVKMWARAIVVSMPLIPAMLAATAHAAGGLVSALTSLVPGVGAFAAAVVGNFNRIKKSAEFGSLKAEWRDFLVNTRPVALEAAASVMETIRVLLPKLVPLADAFGEVFTNWVDEIRAGLESKAFDKFLNWARVVGAANFDNLLDSISNLVGGIGNLSMAMSSSGMSVTGWLEKMTGKFRDWTAELNKSGGLDKFYAFWRDNWPPLRDMFIAFTAAVTNIVVALAPLGPTMVRALTAVFNAIAGANPAHIRAVALALLAFRGINLTLSAAAFALDTLNGGLGRFRRHADGMDDAGRKTERGFIAAGRGATAARLGILGAGLAIGGVIAAMVGDNEKLERSWNRLKENATQLGNSLKQTFGPALTTILTFTFNALATGADKAAKALPVISLYANIAARGAMIAFETMLRGLGRLLEGFARTAAKLAPFNPVIGRIASGMAGAAGNAYRLADAIARLRNRQITITTVFRTIGYLPMVGIAGAVMQYAYSRYAAGGRPPVGRASLVGERGPEMFVPDRPGTILPADVTRSLLGNGVEEGGGSIDEALLARLVARELARALEGVTLRLDGGGGDAAQRAYLMTGRSF